MKKTWKVFLTLVTALVAVVLVACGQGTASKDNKEAELKKIDFILDWTPNTNHTGLYVAKEKGYFKEAGVDVDLKLPPEESSSDLVINGKAPFAVYFQDYMAKKLEKGAGITAVAAIVEHNTSGIISRKSDNVASPKDLVGKKYGTWNDPTELAMLKTLVESQGGDFEKVEKVPNNDSNSITPIANGVFDTAWIYYGWDGILAKSQGVEANFMYLKDYVKEFDYYSPVIIANNDYLKDNKEEARKVIQAIKKGYQYAMEHPEEAADILIKNAPELQEKRDFVIESQKYLSKEYASDKEKWGQFDAARWNAFYKWDKENGILAKSQGVDANFMYLKDYVKEFDYYSPVIIANNDYLKDNKEEARKVIQAIKKGYQYAMEHPEEAADILIKNAPELKEKRDFVIESQKYLSKEYASDKEKWGQFDAARWNAFYKWDKENGILKEDLTDKGFTNEFVK